MNYQSVERVDIKTIIKFSSKSGEEGDMRIGTTKENEELFKQMEQVFGRLGEPMKFRMNTPEANSDKPVYWIEDPAIWARFSPTHKETTLQCLFGSRRPDNYNTELRHEVEINLPLEQGRSHGPHGSAIVDNSGRIYLGHRGLLGGNVANVSMQEFREKIRGFHDIDVSCGNSKTSFFVIGPVDGEAFISDLSRYVAECFRMRQLARGLQAEDADENIEPPDEISALERRNISIKRRRGQQAFRNKLIKTYDGKCAISGCEVLDVLEAAHLKNYDGQHTNVLPNGLLLRADLHTLLDCNLMAIDPETRKVRFSKQASGSLSYKNFEGKEIMEPNNPKHKPSYENLKSLFDKLK